MNTSVVNDTCCVATSPVMTRLFAVASTFQGRPLFSKSSANCCFVLKGSLLFEKFKFQKGCIKFVLNKIPGGEASSDDV